MRRVSDTTPTVETPRRRDIPSGVVMVGMAIAVWWPAFTLGAWGELFFDQILTIWAASTAAFVYVLTERRPAGARIWRAFVLLLPSAWILLMFALNDESADLFEFLLTLAGIVAVLIGIPFTLWVLVRIVWPDFSASTSRRTKGIIVLVVLGVALVSFVLGLNQSRFLTCGDFEISGNSQPPGCTPEPVDSP